MNTYSRKINFVSRLLLIWVAMLYTTSFAANGAGSVPGSIQLAENLAADAMQASSREQIILLLISQSDCSYCEQIKHDILNPMIKSGAFERSVLIRELMIDFDNELTDFQGKFRQGMAIADDYGINFTPTILFLDATGQSLVEPLIGLTTPEYYPFYLERSIQEAIELNQQKRL